MLKPPEFSTLRRYAPSEPLERRESPIEQWLLWEEQANLPGFRTRTEPTPVSIAEVPVASVSIAVHRHAPPDLVARFLRGDRVRFPRHPLNQDVGVPFFSAPEAERWMGRWTSSRSIAIPPVGRSSFFSIKLATDHPHPDWHQPEKTQLREEALWTVASLDVVDRADRWLGGPDPEVRLMRECLVIQVEGSEAGCIVRDLSFFQDGHHYLPGAALPFVGPQLARLAGVDFADYFGEHFASSVGRAKARLFARYGLWYDTPNPQNLLLQLDRNYAPTGAIVFRDLGDTYCATDALTSRARPWTRLEKEIRPETRVSFWAFDESGEHSIAPRVLGDWCERHDRAYFGELASWFPELAGGSELDPGAGDVDGTELARLWSDALRTAKGQSAIATSFANRRLGSGRAQRSSWKRSGAGTGGA
jgi:hypothetical protein